MDALLDLSRKSREFEVTAAMGPQHGMRGERQDNMLETPDYVDPIWGVPVFSLYGEVRRPTSKMLDTFDVLLIDLQDVGTRIYTYLTTLLYVLEAGAKNKKTIVILDRPNPAGRPIEGSLLEPGWVSFVGAAEGLPMRHGLTLGEAALWFKKKLRIDVDLDVIAMEGYRPDTAPDYGWPQNEIAWVNPSPNASSVSMARAFPGSVLIEGTQLSEGRGTTRPLETVGGPGLDVSSNGPSPQRVLRRMAALNSAWMQGALLRPAYFLPTFQKHSGQIISGFQIHCDSKRYQHSVFKPYRLIALWLKAIRMEFPEYSIWRNFHYEYEKDRLAIDLINGGPCLREWVDDSAASVADFDQRVKGDESKWSEERRPFLLYEG